jgi:type I restriction enzyme, S subunit
MSKIKDTVKLKQVAIYSKKRIDCGLLNSKNFIGTDNLQQNKTGKTKALYTPINGTVTKYDYGDILIANIRPYLKKIWYATSTGGSSADVLTLVVNKEFDSKFVYYNLFKDDFFNHMMVGSKGTKMPRGDKNQILCFPIPEFSLIDQQKIAHILSTLDLKIKLNNKINAELEKMAKTLYDYWFVQFDFPDEKGRPYKSSDGEMVWNDELKRDIPKGWEVKRIDQIESSIITGKTPSTKVPENFNGEIPFICIGDVRGDMHIVKTETTLSKKGAETQKNKYIPEGTICVTCIASPGLVGFATEESQTNQQLNSIVCKKFENKYYLYFYLQDYFKYAKAKSGNTFANMNKEDFSSIKTIKPSDEILLKFANIIQPSIGKILTNTKENQKLAELRDWLLPMLMNGQVKVV